MGMAFHNVTAARRLLIEMTLSSTYREATVPEFPLYEEKKICGLGKTVFWITFGVVCLLPISGGVAGNLGAVVLARSTSGYPSRVFTR